MDQLKQNLHFVVFGGGILLGIILTGVGFVMRGGSAGGLEAKAKELSAKQAIFSQGDLTAAANARQGFDKELEAAQGALKTDGNVLRRNLSTESDTRRFYSDEVLPFVTNMRTRWEKMNAQTPLPERIKGWIWKRGPVQQQDYWQRLDTAMAGLNQGSDGPKLAEYRMRLRVIEEVTTTAEKLLATGRYPNQGIKLLDFKFDALAYSERTEAESPFEVLPFTFDIEASPELSLALMKELLVRTDISMQGSDGQPGAGKRLGFPLELVTAQSEQFPRPLAIRYRITNDMRAKEGIDAGMKADSDQGIRVLRQKAEEYERKDRLALPMHFAFKMKAMSFNSRWKVLQEQTE
ncbi:MAG: hypothetical protein KF696_02020 [Planctomycetes bacterium]|nr:hypothetical protein [Planctomycetota bacterium]MCW8134778.1 hypothetical protein [Planctomycetota bacterium]